MAKSGDIIYDEESFIDPFLEDVKNAKKSIFIVSPFVKTRKVKWLIDGILENFSKVNVTIVTRPHDSFFGKTEMDVLNGVTISQNDNVNVISKEFIHQKFAIIDEKIVWYGSINFLSFETSKESVMRIVTGSVAGKLIKSVI